MKAYDPLPNFDFREPPIRVSPPRFDWQACALWAAAIVVGWLAVVGFCTVIAWSVG